MKAIVENIIPIIVVIAVAIITFMAFRINQVSKRLPIITQTAIVRNKKIDEWKYAAGSPVIKEYIVNFELENNMLVDIKVAKRVDYENLFIEDKGQLYYQKKGKTLLYVDFVK